MAEEEFLFPIPPGFVFNPNTRQFDQNSAGKFEKSAFDGTSVYDKQGNVKVAIVKAQQEDRIFGFNRKMYGKDADKFRILESVISGAIAAPLPTTTLSAAKNIASVIKALPRTILKIPENVNKIVNSISSQIKAAKVNFGRTVKYHTLGPRVKVKPEDHY